MLGSRVINCIIAHVLQNHLHVPLLRYCTYYSLTPSTTIHKSDVRAVSDRAKSWHSDMIPRPASASGVHSL